MPEGDGLVAQTAEAAHSPASRLLVLADVQLFVDVFFVAFLGLVALARWDYFQPLALPTGADPGNWLALGRALGHLAGMPGGVVYPPLVPSLALAADLVGRPIEGLKLIASIGSVAPAAGAYTAARLCGARWTAAIPCAFLALASSASEAAGWGGYAQLLGLGLMPVALAMLDRTLRDWRPATAALCGIALAATLSANELVALITVIAAAVIAGIHVVVLGHRPPALRRLATVAALVVLPSFLLAPTYYELLRAIAVTHGTKPAQGTLAVRDILPFIYREFPAFWLPAQVLALATPAVLLVDRSRRLWPLVAAVTFSFGLLLVGLRETRFAYAAPMAAVLGLVTWLDVLDRPGSLRRRGWAAAVAALLLPLLAYQATAAAQLFHVQVAYYAIVPGDWVPVLEYLRDQTAPDSVVAVGPNPQDFPDGWWVQGLGQRQALISSDPAWLSFPGERERATEAASIFDSSETIADSLRRAQSLGVTYLLVDKRWPRYAAWYGYGAGATIVMDQPDVALIRVSSPA